MAEIHPTALVDPHAELASSVTVGPYSVIGPHVRIGEGTTIGSHCVIEGHVEVGRNNRIWQFCSLGAAPQDKKYAGEPTRLEIGDDNTIREFCTFNTGTVQDGGVTRIGNDNWLMAYVHLAHDCQLGNHIIMANLAQLAGHVHLGDFVFIGGQSGVHQFVRVGAHAMAGFQTRLSQDVPPFMTVTGSPATAQGINAEGLRRRGFSPTRLAAIKRMHRLLYRENLTLEAARSQLESMTNPSPEAVAETAAAGTADDAAGLQADRALMLDFLRQAERGIVR